MTLDDIGRTSPPPPLKLKPPFLTTERAFQRGVEAFDAVLETFGMWPPEPEFESWPACWLPYQHLCDTMPRMLKELGDPATFRTWMKQELLDKVRSNVC